MNNPNLPKLAALLDCIAEDPDNNGEEPCALIGEPCLRPAIDELLARIADLELELATVNSLLDMKREREQHWSDEAWRYKQLAEQLRAERNAT